MLDLVTRVAAGKQVGLLTPIANIWTRAARARRCARRSSRSTSMPFIARDLLDETRRRRST